MQCCVTGVVINDTPKICIHNPDNLAHAIEVTDLEDTDGTLHIPLELQGVTSCFNVCCPRIEEFDGESIP